MAELEQGESQEDQPPLLVQDITGNILGLLYKRGCVTEVQQGESQEEQPPLLIQTLSRLCKRQVA